VSHAATDSDYRVQTPAVAERFRKLKERPVVLEVENLGREFAGQHGPVTALENISFKVHRREFLCVLGPSGCGKSTLIRLVAGLDLPTSGRMLLDGHEVHGPGPDRGMVFQGYTLFPWRTVLQNVMFGLQMRGMDQTQAQSEAMQWIELVGLTPFKNSFPVQLSGGMKQRVAIARALANNPRILLMDEPFGALDAQTRAQMQHHLLQIWKNVDVTILFITHDLDEAIYLADRILVLQANPGRVHELIEVPVPRPRSPEQFNSAEFLATKARLEALIHQPKSSDTANAATDNLPIYRLTQVGDDVE